MLTPVPLGAPGTSCASGLHLHLCSLAGTYSDGLSEKSEPCKSCPTGRTTVAAGSNSVEDCKLCSPGFGGTNCSTICGGAEATYGPPGREVGSPCLQCSAQGKTVTYSFNWVSWLGH